MTTRIGKRYGRLVVIGQTDERSADGSKKLLCQCDCGKTCDVHACSLSSKKTQSCGCASWPNMVKVNDVFENLTVIAEHETRSADRQRQLICKCACGSTVVVRAGNLKSGNVKSCGCLKKRHGHASKVSGRSPTYRSWQAMIQRCLNPNYPRYQDWGGRGISVCERWLKFDFFLADMGPRPPETTLDRIDNNGNYEPGNCHWATAIQQGYNRRRTS